MVIHMDQLTPLGQLLEAARGSTSKRAAARAAGISEGRWRQIVTGVQKVGGGVEVQANPKRETVIAMAQAVGVDVGKALAAAKYELRAHERASASSDADDPTFAAIDADPRYDTDEDRERVKALIRVFRDGGAPGASGANDHGSAAGGR